MTEFIFTIIVSIIVLLTMVLTWQRKKYAWLPLLYTSGICMTIAMIVDPINIIIPLSLFVSFIFTAFAHVEWASENNDDTNKVNIRNLNNKYLNLVLIIGALSFILMTNIFNISILLGLIGVILLMKRYLESWIFILFSLLILINLNISIENYLPIQYVFMICCAYDAFFSWRKSLELIEK